MAARGGGEDIALINLRGGAPKASRRHMASLLDATRDEYAKVWNAPLPREATSLLADAYAGLRAKEEMEKRRRLRARLMVWRYSAVIVDLSRGRRCIGYGRAR